MLWSLETQGDMVRYHMHCSRDGSVPGSGLPLGPGGFECAEGAEGSPSREVAGRLASNGNPGETG